MTDTNNNDLRYLIFLILLTFIVGCLTSGCTAPPQKTRASLDCKDPAFKDDIRCEATWYKIEVDEQGDLLTEIVDQESEEWTDVEF